MKKTLKGEETSTDTTKCERCSLGKQRDLVQNRCKAQSHSKEKKYDESILSESLHKNSLEDAKYPVTAMHVPQKKVSIDLFLVRNITAVALLAHRQKRFITISLLLVTAAYTIHNMNQLSSDWNHILSLENLATFQSTIPSYYPPSSHRSHFPRLLFITDITTSNPLISSPPHTPRALPISPSPYSDVTQLYPDIDSSDPPYNETMEPRIFPRHEVDATCRPMTTWQTTFHPSCLAFHEMGMREDLVKKRLVLFGTKGFWRHAWVWRSLGEGRRVVAKTMRYEHNFEEAYYENTRIDAVAMEHLTHSPNIMPIYGYCGTSLLSEFAPTRLLVNNKSPFQKLRLLRHITAGVAAVHDEDDKGRAMMVHNDLNLANVVVGRGGVPMLNDFNIAVLLMEDENGRVCGFPSHFPNPQWKAPEEQENAPLGTLLTEKIDIYALGNIIYRFLVGGTPWRNHTGSLTPEEKESIATVKLQGGTPPVPREVILSQEPADVVMRKLMMDCYRFDPKKRPSAKQILGVLEKAIANLEMLS